MPDRSTLRICLWSSPRNISTALMYAFAQRPDTTVVDEPLYGYYLAQSQARHPGREEVMASMDCNGSSVVANVLLGGYPTPVVFFKHMTHHMTGGLSADFMEHMHNIFFIRDPKYILRSYAKVIEQPVLSDIGIAQQMEFVKIAQQNNYPFSILDAGELLQNPDAVLSELCNRLGIPYFSAMTQWSPGPRKEDGVWAKYWYANVHNSSGFKSPEEINEPLPEALLDVYSAALPYYQQLKLIQQKF